MITSDRWSVAKLGCTALSSPHNSPVYYSTLHSFFLIASKTLQKLNFLTEQKKIWLIRNLQIYQNWFGRDLVFEFLSQNMSLIVLKLCFLQADFEQIYQKHVSRPSWQAFLASGHQIFRANFKTGWTNRQPLMEAKLQQLNIYKSFQGQPTSSLGLWIVPLENRAGVLRVGERSAASYVAK